VFRDFCVVVGKAWSIQVVSDSDNAAIFSSCFFLGGIIVVSYFLVGIIFFFSWTLLLVMVSC
jgi:hypothetical protein